MSDSTVLLQPKLNGERFNGGVIPLEFLKDLAVLEEMVIEIAKEKYKVDHPERVRSPKGFTQGVQFKLTAIKDGSAIPTIALSFTTAELFPPENVTYFEKARDSIIASISAAEHDEKTIKRHLSPKALAYFDRFGRSLREGESIEFTTMNGHGPARLTKQTRLTLVKESNVDEYTDDVVVRGDVIGSLHGSMVFHVQLVDGTKITANLTRQHAENVFQAQEANYFHGTRALVSGVGRFGRNGRLQSIESVEHVEILDPRDVSLRIDELRLLRDGWLDRKGKAPSHAGLNWLDSAFARHYPDDLVPPCLFPTESGGIQAEWQLHPHDISLAIDLDTKKSLWHHYDHESGEDNEREIDLQDPSQWESIVKEIRRLGGGAYADTNPEVG